MKRKKGFFSISAVAKMFSVHQQTIRLYEKEGLITPKRSEGNTRLFSEEDVDRLEEIMYLTHQLGINLAGVEMIFKLKKQIKKMQKDMNKLFDETQDELDKEAEAPQQAVKESARGLLKIKNAQLKRDGRIMPDLLPAPEKSTQKNTDKQQNFAVENWEVEYDED